MEACALGVPCDHRHHCWKAADLGVLLVAVPPGAAQVAARAVRSAAVHAEPVVLPADIHAVLPGAALLVVAQNVAFPRHVVAVLRGVRFRCGVMNNPAALCRADFLRFDYCHRK